MKSNVLLEGDLGTGKTSSLITLQKTYIDHSGATKAGAGLDTFLISMESGAEAVLSQNFCDTHPDGLHIHYIPPTAVPWATVREYVKLANQLPLDNLLKTADPNKRHYQQLMELYSVCQNFTCDRCNRDFGDVGEWDDSRAVALDGLTSLTTAAIQNLVGGKPIRSLPEIGTIMDFIESFMRLFWGNTKCTAVLLAHVDREVSPLTGMSTLTAHTIGQKLAPRLTKMADEVIVSLVNDNQQYRWSTAASGVELKHRRLPLSDSLAPNFAQLFSAR